jgi:hypothetical protein
MRATATPTPTPSAADSGTPDAAGPVMASAGAAGTMSGSAGMGGNASAPASNGLTPDELLQECGVAPPGLAPTSDLLTPVPTAFVAPVYDGAILYPHSMDYLREHVAEDQPVLLRPIETGHFPQREEPPRLASMIRQFVNVDWQTP